MVIVLTETSAVASITMKIVHFKNYYNIKFQKVYKLENNVFNFGFPRFIAYRYYCQITV